MDILELLRSGTLSNYPGTLEPGTIRMELGDLHAPGQVHAVELTDQEGVPLARLPLQRGPEGSWLALGEPTWLRSEEHTSELQSRGHLVCRLLLEKKSKDD